MRAYMFDANSVSPETGLIDFDELKKLAALFKPALIVCGGSAYPRDW
jgi:glycine hydroxymethyltransferase